MRSARRVLTMVFTAIGLRHGAHRRSRRCIPEAARHFIAGDEHILPIIPRHRNAHAVGVRSVASSRSGLYSAQSRRPKVSASLISGFGKGARLGTRRWAAPALYNMYVLDPNAAEDFPYRLVTRAIERGYKPPAARRPGSIPGGCSAAVRSQDSVPAGRHQ